MMADKCQGYCNSLLTLLLFFAFHFGFYSFLLPFQDWRIHASGSFALASAALTILDAANNGGWQIHNTIDVAADAITFVQVVGEVFALGWFVGNMISESVSGRSLSANIQKAIESQSLPSPLYMARETITLQTFSKKHDNNSHT